MDCRLFSQNSCTKFDWTGPYTGLDYIDETTSDAPSTADTAADAADAAAMAAKSSGEGGADVMTEYPTIPNVPKASTKMT